jgi:hypothetical protein
MTYDMEGLLNEDVVQSPILLDIMKRNIATNAPQLKVRVQPAVHELEWGPAYESQLEGVLRAGASMSEEGGKGGYDVLLGSDLTYHSSTAGSLFWTVSTLLNKMTATRRKQERENNCRDGDGEDDEEEGGDEDRKIKFITAHEHRLDISTKETLNVAVNKFQLQHKEIFVSNDNKHSIWMFTLKD